MFVTPFFEVTKRKFCMHSESEILCNILFYCEIKWKVYDSYSEAIP